MPENARDQDSLLGRIKAALHEMPDLLAHIFILSHYRGLCASEIADETGFEESKVLDLLSEANRFFYQALGSGAEVVAAAEAGGRSPREVIER